MKRRVIGILVALVFAFLGTVMLISFVNKARDNAVITEAQVKVLVLTSDVVRGTTMEGIKTSVSLVEIPKRLVTPGALTSLTDLDNSLVAAIDLKMGEQLLANRLVAAADASRILVPKGLNEITIRLDPERAVGGDLAVGDSVGILMSFAPTDLSTTDPAAAADGGPTATTVTSATAQPGAAGRTPSTTHYTLHNILVTQMQYSTQDADRISKIKGDQSLHLGGAVQIYPFEAVSPADQILVSLGVTAPEAEQLVFAAEFGTIWLVGEGPITSNGDTRIVTLSQVYVPVPR
jgi:pilus assembly protein CpaB